MTNPDLSPYEEEIERICASPAFRQAPKQARLLRYLAGEALAGRGGELNQYLIATDGMGLGENFDPTKSALVRVWGGRLRQMLTAYYRGPGRSSPRRVRLPERTYCPVFEIRGEPGARITTEESAPKMAVMEFRGVGLRGSWRHFPSLLAENIVACTSTIDGLSALGPFERPHRVPSGAIGAAVGTEKPPDFILDGSVHGLSSGCRVQARLLRGGDGTVCRAQAFSCQSQSRSLSSGDLPVARKVARFVEEGIITVQREVVRAALGRPVEEISAKEAMMLVWRAYSTMSPQDIAAAQSAMRKAQVK